MKNLIGRKCKGFKFEGRKTSVGNYNPAYNEKMNKHIGEIGEITAISELEERIALIQFKNAFFYYPLSEIEKHLVLEIPELGEGVLMEVSNHKDFKPSYEDMVLGIYKGSFLTMDEEDWWIWKYAKPIKQKTTLTLQEIADKFEIDINQLIIE